jgi:hypothetical protein
MRARKWSGSSKILKLKMKQNKKRSNFWKELEFLKREMLVHAG